MNTKTFEETTGTHNSIKQERRRQKMTQVMLAQKSGLSEPVIVRLEKGQNINRTSLLLVCYALGVKIEDVSYGVHFSDRTGKKQRKNVLV